MRNRKNDVAGIIDHFVDNNIMTEEHALKEIANLVRKRNLMLGFGKGVHIYCDMDGVLAKWMKDTVEHMKQNGYFRGLPLEEGVRDCLLLLTAAGYKVSILSSVLQDCTADKDKAMWLKDYGMGMLDKIFVPNGDNKKDYVHPENKEEMQILMDDYNTNLLNWKREGYNFVGIKFLNKENGSSMNWTGRTVYCHSDGVTLANTLADIAVMN